MCLFISRLVGSFLLPSGCLISWVSGICCQAYIATVSMGGCGNFFIRSCNQKRGGYVDWPTASYLPVSFCCRVPWMCDFSPGGLFRLCAFLSSAFFRPVFLKPIYTLGTWVPARLKLCKSVFVPTSYPRCGLFLPRADKRASNPGRVASCFFVFLYLCGAVVIKNPLSRGN